MTQAKRFDMARIYMMFRGSKYFLLALGLLCLVWIVVHWVTGFDSDLGELDTVLSIEASLSLALVGVGADAQEAWQKRMAEDQRRLAVATLAAVEAVKLMLEREIEKEASDA